MNYKFLGEQIRKQRKLKKYTLEQLAEILDVSTTFIGQIERAKGVPSLETLVKIANALEISVDSLLFENLNSNSGDTHFLNKITELTETFTPREKNLVLKNIELLKEFKEKEFTCKYKDCLHITEDNCGAREITDNMHPSRYESYKKFVAEAKEYEEKIKKESIKSEAKVKFNQNRMMTKISNKKRNLSRKTSKQNMYKEEDM